MAYKRTSKTLGGKGGVRMTQNHNTNGKSSTSTSRKNGPVRTTYSSNGDVWRTYTSPLGWVTKEKLNKKPKTARAPRRKKSSTSAGSPEAALWVLVFVGIVVYTIFFK